MQIKINLLYPSTEAELRKKQKGLNKPLLALCLVLGVLAIVLTGGLYWYNMNLEKDIQVIDKKIAALNSTQLLLDERNRLNGDIRLIEKETDNAVKNQNSASKVLDEIAKIIPRNVKTTKVTIEYSPFNDDKIQRSVMIRGNGPDHLSVAQFARQLQISPLAELALISFSRKQDPAQPASFEVNITSSSPKGGAK